MYILQRGIDVIVEIDTPGHTTSIAESTPNLLLAPSLPLGINLPTVRFSQASQIGVRLTGFTEPPAGQLRLANPDTIKFTADLVKNVASMFPSKYFSTGGDEINANCYAMDNHTQQELGMSLVK